MAAKLKGYSPGGVGTHRKPLWLLTAALLLVSVAVSMTMPNQGSAASPQDQIVYGGGTRYYGRYNSVEIDVADPDNLPDSVWAQVSKTLAPGINENEFTVNLEVSVKQEDVTVITSAPTAVCLVLDLSGSMWRCAYCNGGQSSGGYNGSQIGSGNGVNMNVHGTYGNENGASNAACHNVRRNGVTLVANGTSSSSQINDRDRRWYKMLEAVIAFIDIYADAPAGSQRLLSIVGFATDAEILYPRSNRTTSNVWINVADPAVKLQLYNTLLNTNGALTQNVSGNASVPPANSFKSLLVSSYTHNDIRGTNMDGGLMLARNLFLTGTGNAFRSYMNSVDESNCNVILFSDGATIENTNPNNVTSTTITKKVWDGVEDRDLAKTMAIERAREIRKDSRAKNTYTNKKCTLYTVAFGGDGVASNLNGLADWLRLNIATSNSTAFMVGDANNLGAQFTALAGLTDGATTTTTKPVVGSVTDPMGQYIVWDSPQTNLGNGAIYTGGGARELTWNLANAAGSQSADGKWTTYTFSYNIKLDNLAQGWSPGLQYKTNGTTTFSYTVGGASMKVDFEVPEVKGFAATFQFVKVDDSPTPLPIKGMKFSIFADGSTPEFSKTVESDASGIVNFGSLPSGHTYRLVEIEPPRNYVGDPNEIKFIVEYGGIVSFDVGNNKAFDPIGMTFTNETVTVEIIVEKEWDDRVWTDDSNYIDFGYLRPGYVDIQLKQNGFDYRSPIRMTANSGWADVKFEGLPAYDADGEEYTYTAVEVVTPAGYSQSYSPVGGTKVGGIITITNSLDLISVSGQKSWQAGAGVTAGDLSGIHPSSISVELLRNNAPMSPRRIAVVSAPGWGYKFEGLGGLASEYSVRELPFELSDKSCVNETSYSGFDIINTITREYVTIGGIKTWVGDSGSEYIGYRPAPGSGAPVLHLFTEHGEEVAGPGDYTVTDNLNNTWSYMFTGLFPKYDKTTGELMEYIVEEEPTLYYRTAYANPDPIDANGHINTYLTNTLDVEHTSITGHKTWNDSEDIDNTRPVFVSGTGGITGLDIRLLADGTPAPAGTYTVSWSLYDENTWEYTIEGIPGLPNKGAGGEVIVYTVEEVLSSPYAERYTIMQYGLHFVNTILPGNAPISVTKKWEGEGGFGETLRPAGGVEIEVLRPNGSVAGSVVLNQTGSWTHTFDLPRFDEYGHVIKYSVKEVTVPHYTAIISGDHEEGFTITNTLNAVDKPLIEKRVSESMGVPVKSLTVDVWTTVTYTISVRNPSSVTWYGAWVTDAFFGRAVDGVYVNGIKTALIAENSVPIGDLWPYGDPFGRDIVLITYDVELFRPEHKPNTATLRAHESSTYSGDPPYIAEDKCEVVVRNSTIAIEVEKVWNDDGDALGIRPGKAGIIVYEVLPGGEGLVIAGKAEIGPPTWRVTVPDLVRYNNDGSEKVYKVVEEEVAHYITVGDVGDETIGFTITNRPDLTGVSLPGITKSVSGESIPPGASVQYTVIVTNSGIATWHRATVTDEYISKAVSGSVRVGTTRGGNELTASSLVDGDTVRLGSGILAPGDVVYITYEVVFDEEGTYPNTAVLRAYDKQTESAGDEPYIAEDNAEVIVKMGVTVMEDPDDEDPDDEDPHETPNAPDGSGGGEYIPPPPTTRPPTSSGSPSPSPSVSPPLVSPSTYTPPSSEPEPEPEPEPWEPFLEPEPEPDLTPWVEYDEDGVPMGTWAWDPVTETWIFTMFPPLAELPQTGAVNLHAVLFPIGLAMIGAGLLIRRFRGRRVEWPEF